MPDALKAPLLLRVLFIAGCVVLVLTCAMHLVATLAVQPEPPDETGRQLNSLVKTYKLELPGVQRTYEQIIQGYSLHFAGSLAGIAILSAVAVRGRPSALRPVAAVDALLAGAMVANSIAYFFIIPTIQFALATVLFAAAAITSRTTPAAQA